MKVVADMHLHTIVSSHAFSTVYELCLEAKRKGLSAIAVTDHAPAITDGAHEWHFLSLRSLPRRINDIFVLRGVELNLLDYEGHVDLDENALERLDFVIVSMHEPCFDSGGVERNTQAWLRVLENPHVDCLGHMGNPRFPCDYGRVIEACARKGKIVEINAQSFQVRPGSYENCEQIARLCVRFGVPMALNSDGHYMSYVGQVERSIELLEKIGCPPELVINSSAQRLKDYFMSHRGLALEIDPAQ